MDKMEIGCGVARDGIDCNKQYLNRENTEAWYMGSCGDLNGNGKEGDDHAGEINDGQVLTMQVDLDASTLKFWFNGKPRGPGWTSGVTGRLTWATNVYYKGSNVFPDFWRKSNTGTEEISMEAPLGFPPKCSYAQGGSDIKAFPRAGDQPARA